MLNAANSAPIKPRHVKTYTFGCKVNQADTAMMENILAQTTDCQVNQDAETPDLVVINTCTVTAQADQQARQLIRKMHRNFPDAKIVVTGCYAESKPKEIEELAGVQVVLPLAGQKKISELFGVTLDPGQQLKFFPQKKKTRLTLKLQDGCNAYCSFCILPYVRGRSKSIDPAELVAAASSAQASYREIVLTGTHIGAYGRDLQPRIRLSDMVRRMIAATDDVHFRISSLEPTGLTKDFIQMVAKEDRVRPHFHIPLQSGSDAVLKRMNRKYSVKNYEERVTALCESKDRTAIGADVIVGYPGETDGEFHETFDLIRRLPLTYLHVFPYSPREGTKSHATLADDVGAKTKKERVHMLREWAAAKKFEFFSTFVGTTQKVLVEKKKDAEGNLTAHNPQYIPVHLHGSDRLMQQEVEVRYSAVENDAAHDGEFYLKAELV